MESKLDKCRRLCEVICNFDFHPDEPLSKSPQRLIGYGLYADIFRGLIPLAEYDDSGSFSYLDDFSEIFPNSFPTQQRTGSAVLFTGGTGCGKHTADYTFMSLVYQFVENEITAEMEASGGFDIPEPSDLDQTLEFYQIDISAYDEFSERKLGEDMDDLFEQIYAKAFSRPQAMFYFSLGDVTRILDSKRLAPRFADKVARLIADTRARCVLTCIYTGKASSLNESVKKPFYVLEFEPPGKSARIEYFEYLIKNYPNIRFRTDADKLAELTDGFTFAEIKKLAGYMMMTAKNELKKRKVKLSSARFASDRELDIVNLSEEKIQAFAEMISRSRYTPPEPAAPVYAAPAYGPAAYGPPAPQGYYPPAPEANAAQNNRSLGDDPDADSAEDVKKQIGNYGKPRQVRRAIDSMVVPAGYKLPVLMNHRTFYTSVFNVFIVTVDDFLAWCSDNGLTNLSNLKSVTISLGGNMVLHPQDKNLLQHAQAGKKYDYKEIIREGKLLTANLERIGKDKEWLQDQMIKNGCRSTQEIFLGACDENGELIIFRKE